jgi:hypothetical protein
VIAVWTSNDPIRAADPVVLADNTDPTRLRQFESWRPSWKQLLQVDPLVDSSAQFINALGNITAGGVLTAMWSYPGDQIAGFEQAMYGLRLAMEGLGTLTITFMGGTVITIDNCAYQDIVPVEIYAVAAKFQIPFIGQTETINL